MLRPAMRHMYERCVDSRVGPLSLAGWNLVSELRIALVTVTSRHTFQRLRGRKHLRVHLGCGDDIREGWVNIDLNLSKRTCRSKLEQSGTALINHDLRLGLPL